MLTKIQAPRAKDGVIDRPRLHERLSGAAASGVTLICAPAGYGKTTLALSWLRQTGSDSAWLALDPYDNDFQRFWGHLIASIDRIVPGLAERMDGALAGVGYPVYQTWMPQLLNELAVWREKLVIVLDDYHLIESPAIHAAMGYFLGHLPGNVRIVLISRTEPPIPLSRLLARDELLRIGPEDLSLTYAESMLYCESLRLNLASSEVKQLADKTEGWITGMKLAALSIREGNEVGGLLARMSGSQRYIADYLFEEVFGLQPEPIRRFLTATSILEQFNGDLCAAVTGEPDSPLLLERLERAGLFVVSLDERREWYRYHHLFAEFLKFRLHGTARNDEMLWHQRASRWFEANGMLPQAIEHSIRGGEERRAVDLIGRALPSIVHQGWETLHRWFHSLSRELLEEYPDLFFTHVYFQTVLGDWDSVKSMVARAEHIYESRRDGWTPEEANRYAGRLYLIKSYEAVEYLMDWRLGVEYSRRYFEYLPQGDVLHDADIDTGEMSVLRGFLCLAGRLNDAETFFTDMIDIWRNSESPFASVFLTGYAEVLYERNERDAAEQAARQAYAIAQSYNTGQLLVPAAIVLSNLYLQRRDETSAFRILEQTRHMLAGRNRSFWADLLDTRLIRMRLDRAERAEWEQWLASHGQLLEEELLPFQMYHALTAVRLLIALGRDEDVRYRTQALLIRARGWNRLGDCIELHILDSLQHVRAGRMQIAFESLSRALALAEPEGYFRIFLDEGEEMAKTLAAYVRTGPHPRPEGGKEARLMKHARRLLKTIRTEHPAPFEHDGLSRMQRDYGLTAKEAEVLKLLAEGMPGRQIASAMGITVGTVKTHLNRIYDKMQVNGRWEAIRAIKLRMQQNGPMEDDELSPKI